MKQETEDLDLTKSADSQERFKTRRIVPWEGVVVFFYLATMVAFIMATGPTDFIDNFQRVEFVLACGLFALFGAVLVAAIQRNVMIKSDYDRRRAILISVLEGSDGAHLISDDRHKTVYANMLLYDILGKGGKKTIDDLVSLGMDERTQEKLSDFIEDMKQKGVENILVFPYRKDSKKGWYRMRARAVTGWPSYIHWRLDDISDAHENLKDIDQERERLSDFMDHAPIGFMCIDQNGVFQFVNQAVIGWLAAEDQNLLDGSHTIHDFLVDIPDGAKPYDMILEGAHAMEQRGEIKMRSFDGRVFVASVSHTVIPSDTDGIYTRTILRDLTPEKAWKKALKQSEDRFQRFFEEAPLGIALVDNYGRVSECNEAFSKMVGNEFHDLMGKTLADFVIEECKPQVEIVLKNTRDGKIQSLPEEVTFIGDQGVTAQMFASPYMGDTGIVLHFTDVTERKHLESQMAQSQKMQAVGQLAGGIAHDFNNLLTAMIGFCDLLLMRHKAGDPSFADIMQIKQNSNRAANLVRQLLAFSRQQTLQPKMLDLTDTITEVSHLLKRLIGANIELNIKHARDLGMVKVDEGQMEQVLINLVVNARDAMKTGGSVTIKTFNKETKRKRRIGTDEMPAGEWIGVSVTDTGTGIPEDIQERIFDPFFSTKEIGSGTGLGLSTVYGIIRQTNGFIELESVMGEGTTFTVYLPRVERGEVLAAAEIKAADEVKDLTGTARILLVEDEDAVRSFSMRALQNKGYEVFEANSGEDALEKIERDNLEFDLLVTDVIMPDMDGIELSQKVLEKFPDMTVIYMSGYTEDRVKDDLGDNFYFLPKPFTLKQLAEKVKDVLEKTT